MRGNNSGNGDYKGYVTPPSSSGKATAPFPIAKEMRPQKQQAGDLRMNGKNSGKR